MSEQLNVPASLFAKWMKDASADPAIKPVRVIYATRATPDEIRHLKAERMRLERRGRILRYTRAQ